MINLYKQYNNFFCNLLKKKQLKWIGTLNVKNILQKFAYKSKIKFVNKSSFKYTFIYFLNFRDVQIKLCF